MNEIEMNDLEILKYPIGRFIKPEIITEEILASCIRDIENFPSQLRSETIFLNDTQLDTPYREHGWTLRQLVHHCADSHMNSVVRFKLALTEDKPIIKPYDEKRWAELADSGSPIESSISIIESLHRKWVTLLRSFSTEQWKRTFIHPASGKEVSLEETAGLYAWQGKHHLAHIKNLKTKNHWK